MQGARMTSGIAGRRAGRVGVAALMLLASTSCGQLNTTGRSPAFLVIDALTGSSGAKPDSFGNVLESDVVTNVKTTVSGQDVYTATVYEDAGKVSLHMSLKDPGAPGQPTQPTYANDITVTRYHVEFRRSDGRNTQGVDVPFAFDGAATGTFNSNGGTLGFILVRAQAKLEAPLRALRGMGGSIIISTIADVTFYGRDQNGNDVSVAGSISVNFADWGDPA